MKTLNETLTLQEDAQNFLSSVSLNIEHALNVSPMTPLQSSPHLFSPPEVPHEVKQAITQLVQPTNYPCGPAVSSLKNNDYLVGVYSDFGTGHLTKELYNDLLYFRQSQKTSGSLFLSFWAVFRDESVLNEDEFEKALWKELSLLSSFEASSVPWDKSFSSDPESSEFCLSVGGEAFFVVGLHRQSSRESRIFPWPTLIFNLYSQFDELARLGRYDSIVKSNRARELKVHGTLNPMVEKYGDTWEAIQFSGKENPPDWKCPFHRALKVEN